MAKQARTAKVAKKTTRKKATKKTAPKKAVEPSAGEKSWRQIAFGDLHVNAANLHHAIRVLDQVGELAEKHDADIVCMGDFWDVRGVLNTRQVSEVRAAINRWSPERKKRFIPGNHDQVSLDGLVNGMCVLEGLNGVEVIHEPLEVDGLVFLPWRELPDEQRAQFEGIQTKNATIFTHAELEGATANNGHRSRGHVPTSLIESKARACYVSHYHKFQLVGDRSWYIGSPFEQKIDEGGMIHGVALVTSGTPVPTLIELEGFPKHHIITVADDDGTASWVQHVQQGDIVEFRVTPEEAGGEVHKAMQTVVDNLPKECIRQRIVKPDAEESVPQFALGLDDALEAYVAGAEDGSDELLTKGRDYLASLPEARAMAPLGHRVVLDRLVTENFCALAGKLEVPVGDIDRGLIRGPIRYGKTAVLDASMWCLYDATTPRKAGASGATLKADNVINDVASACSVTTYWSVTKADGEVVKLAIKRTRKRGKASKVTIAGLDMPDGISDQDALIEHAVGLNHTLWRACVSLGQGATSNFVTGTDSARKKLLSTVFGLDVCPSALKLAKNDAIEADATVNQNLNDAGRAEARRSELQAQDMSAEVSSWDERHKASLEGAATRGIELKAKLAETKTTLAGEEEWLTLRTQHEENIAAQTGKLVTMTPANRIGQLQRQYGTIEAERSALVASGEKLKKSYADGIEASNHGTDLACDTCGQPLPTGSADQQLEAYEGQIRSNSEEQKTLGVRLSNVAMELDQLNTTGTSERGAIEESITESRGALEKCREALTAFTRIRQSVESMTHELENARTDFRKSEASKNPFTSRQAENQARIEELTGEIDSSTEAAVVAQAEADDARFWVVGFGNKGIPALVLKTALYDLENLAAGYLSDMTAGTLAPRLSMEKDDLLVEFTEQTVEGTTQDRQYQQLSGGQRRCAELAFSPFALSDLIFSRMGVSVGLLTVDELTTHLGSEEKQRVCDILERSNRTTILVVDHDKEVQGRFSTLLDLKRGPEGVSLEIV